MVATSSPSQCWCFELVHPTLVWRPSNSSEDPTVVQRTQQSCRGPHIDTRAHRAPTHLITPHDPPAHPPQLSHSASVQHGYITLASASANMSTAPRRQNPVTVLGSARRQPLFFFMWALIYVHRLPFRSTPSYCPLYPTSR